MSLILFALITAQALALARGEIQCVGATTLDEYRQHIEKDGALERRFQEIVSKISNDLGIEKTRIGGRL